MSMGKIQRRASSFLNHPDNRGRWFDTRTICQAAFEEEWPESQQMTRIRQALNLLEKRGEVIRFGHMAEWRTARVPEKEPPRIVREVEAELGPQAAQLLRQVEPEYRRAGLGYHG